MQDKDIQFIKAAMFQDQALQSQSILLQCGECIIRLQSNSQALLQTLQAYFNHWRISNNAVAADINVIAIESAIVELPYTFLNWPREPGKQGAKDAYYDCCTVRLIKKVRTGMLFLQSEADKIAAGPCLAHPNQVINFINSQYMNWLQQRNWLICHASAIVYKKQAYAIAGLSGGGKSTIMLNLLDNNEIDFLTNDRLFIRQQQDSVLATGIAKLPRINPGTIAHNSRLHSLIAESKRSQLLALPKQELWRLEEKYDANIENLYGPKRIADTAPLSAFIILNWQHESQQDFYVEKVNLNEQHQLLAAIMKSPGPFYQDSNGKLLSACNTLDESPYLSILSDTAIYQVSGKVDFQALRDYVDHFILEAE